MLCACVCVCVCVVQLKFPPHFSGELKDCVKNLLQVDITNRYGNMKNGTDDVKNCKFFVVTNWSAILTQSVRSLHTAACTLHNIHSSTCHIHCLSKICHPTTNNILTVVVGFHKFFEQILLSEYAIKNGLISLTCLVYVPYLGKL